MPFYEDICSDFDFQHSLLGRHGNIAGMHLHPHFEAILVANKTEQKTIINGHTLPTIYQPSFTIFAPYSMHQIQFIANSNAERFIFYFCNSMMEESQYAFKEFQQYEQTIFTRFILSDALLNKLRPFLDELVNRKEDRVFTKIVFLMILHIILHESEIDQMMNTAQSLEKINAIIKYMTEHCKENLTAERICKEFYISRSKLNKDFEKYISVGFHHLLSEMRLSQAFYMLKNTNLDIKSIATNLGFENDTYFYTFFKNATGTTPLQYRKTKTKKIKG